MKPTDAKQGLHTHRLSERADNPREVAFAAQWQQEHDYRDVLGTLFCVPCADGTPGAIRGHFGLHTEPLGEVTDRDRVVVATVVQWLGSNVGLSFLMESLKRCGYVIKEQP